MLFVEFNSLTFSGERQKTIKKNSYTIEYWRVISPIKRAR